MSKALLVVVLLLVAVTIGGNIIGFVGGLLASVIIPLLVGGSTGYLLGRSHERKQLNP